jgi:hypothetical protein
LRRTPGGATVNISRSGVLFVPAQGAVPDSGDLLMVVFLSQAPKPSEAGTAMRDLYCGGRVARVAETAGGEPALAVQIEFEWAEKPPEPGWGAPHD